MIGRTKGDRSRRLRYIYIFEAVFVVVVILMMMKELDPEDSFFVTTCPMERRFLKIDSSCSSSKIGEFFGALLCAWNSESFFFVVIKIACVSWSFSLGLKRSFDLQKKDNKWHQWFTRKPLMKRPRSSEVFEVSYDIDIIDSRIESTRRRFFVGIEVTGVSRMM